MTTAATGDLPVVRLRRDALVEVFEDAALVLLLGEHKTVTVDPMTAKLFAELRARCSEVPVDHGDVVAVLIDVCGLDAEEARRGAEDLVEVWLEYGLAEVAERETPDASR